MGAGIGVDCVQMREKVVRNGCSCVDDGRRGDRRDRGVVQKETARSTPSSRLRTDTQAEIAELAELRDQVARLRARNAELEAPSPTSSPYPFDSTNLDSCTTLPPYSGVTLPPRDIKETEHEDTTRRPFPNDTAECADAPQEAKPGVAAIPSSRSSSQAVGQKRCVPVALLFPNQALRLVGMLGYAKDLPGVPELLRRATSVLGYDVEQLCTQGPAQRLDETRCCQPAVYVASLAAIEVLRHQRPEAVEQCQAVAGIGVGEYAALQVAGVFSFEVGLRLVALRAEEMHRASVRGEQRQLSLTGVELERVRALCEEARRVCGREGEVCSVAYSVMSKAHICAGTKEAVHQLWTIGKSQSSVDVRASYLDTPQSLGHGAFQTTLMEQAQRPLRAALREALPLMRPPRCAVYFNAMGEALPAGSDPSIIAELLVTQLVNTVLWEQTVRTMLREGVEEFVVCGPSTSTQLRDVMSRISSDSRRRTSVCSV